jgi:hypothetical protein
VAPPADTAPGGDDGGDRPRTSAPRSRPAGVSGRPPTPPQATVTDLRDFLPDDRYPIDLHGPDGDRFTVEADGSTLRLSINDETFTVDGSTAFPLVLACLVLLRADARVEARMHRLSATQTAVRLARLHDAEHLIRRACAEDRP